MTFFLKAIFDWLELFATNTIATFLTQIFQG